MFYEPDKDDHGLPLNPYKSIVVPRPIGWISTISHARSGLQEMRPPAAPPGCPAALLSGARRYVR